MYIFNGIGGVGWKNYYEQTMPYYNMSFIGI